MPNLEKKKCRWCQTRPCIAERDYCEYHAFRVDNGECCELAQRGYVCGHYDIDI